MKSVFLIVFFNLVTNVYAVIDESRLSRTNRNFVWLDQQIVKTTEQLQEKLSFTNRRAIEKQLDELKERKKKVFLQFIEEASGVDIVPLEENKPDKKQKLLDEAQEILLPLIESIKRLSAKPREIERVKNEISKLNELISSRKKARDSLQTLSGDEKYADNFEIITQGINELENEIIKLEIELDGKKRIVKKDESGKTPFVVRFKVFITDFFKTKGKNLFFALVTLTMTYWFMMVFRSHVFKFQIFTGKLEFIRKTLMTLYSSIAMAVSFISAILILYLLNDWLLLTLIVIVLIGILWSLKQYLPQYIGEARLILNLGPVKEDELIMWEGVPYMVKAIGFSTILENPLLNGGTLRIPVVEFFNRQSRKPSENEILFPTHINDWVKFDDNILGQVVDQNPEVVKVKMLGGGIKTFTTRTFFELSVENITGGFVLSDVVGLDYSVQNHIQDVLLKFQNKMREYLNQEAYIRDHVKSINCEFHSAASSSLNIAIFLDCSGELCRYYFKLKREVQKNFVRIANEENLTIPFDQMTIHQA